MSDRKNQWSPARYVCACVLALALACALGLSAQPAADPVTLGDVMEIAPPSATWIDGLRDLIGPALVAIVGWLGWLLRKIIPQVGEWLAEQGKTNKTMRYLAKLETLAADCTLAAIAACEPEIKKAVIDGKISKDEMAKIKAAAVAGVRTHLGSKWDDVCERFGLNESGLIGWIGDKVAGKLAALHLGN